MWSSCMTEPEKWGKTCQKNMKTFAFLSFLFFCCRKEFSFPTSNHILHHHYHNSGKVAVETCQLPFTSFKECWQVFTTLSVIRPDKSSLKDWWRCIPLVPFSVFLFVCFFSHAKTSALSHHFISFLSKSRPAQVVFIRSSDPLIKQHCSSWLRLCSLDSVQCVCFVCEFKDNF